MTAEATPLWLQAGSHNAEITRRGWSAIFGNREGIVTAGSMVVSEKSGTPNMSVDVAEGQLVLAGDEATYQGHYLCENRGVQNVAIAAADPTNPRRDLIIARVRDAAYSGATNTFSIEAVTGTPAGSPSDPSLPSGSCYVLARVAVAASASSITNANITDGRDIWTGQFGRAAALGGTITCTSATRPTSPFEGLEIYETDTDRKLIYNGSAWKTIADLGAWTSGYSPTITQSAAVTKTITTSRWRQVDRDVIWQFNITVTSSGTANNPIILTLPATGVATNLPIGRLIWYNGSVFTDGDAYLASTTTMAALLGKGFAALLGQTASGYPNQLLNTHILRGNVIYEAAS